MNKETIESFGTAENVISNFRDKVEIKSFKEGAVIPKKATSGSAGYDLCACLPEYMDGLMVYPGNVLIVPTGLNVNIPEGYEIQIRPRSGLAAKNMISVLNTPGTIDSDYFGEGEDFELKVILVNFGKIPFTIRHKDRIAQMVICKLPNIDLVEVEEFTTNSNQGRIGGLGSTGIDNKE